MEYNFDEIIPREGTNSIKWDSAVSDSVLPMWVADMDFKAAPAILDALQLRLSHGIFGYTQTPEAFYQSIINWWAKRHGLLLQQEWIIPATGAITVLLATIKALTNKGDKIIIQPPIYNHFYTTIQNAGCEAVENNLMLENGYYTIDFQDLEQKAADPGVKILLISNPHNPTGRVWKREELLNLKTICNRHNVVIVSDEIHSDLIYFPHKHIPIASLEFSGSPCSITITSPTKSFNLAGLQVGYLFTRNTSFQDKIRAMLQEQEVELLNPFAIAALIAAYNDGEEWLDALIRYLNKNYNYLKEFVSQNMPLLKVLPLEATYLVWLDCSKLHESSVVLAQELLREGNLWVNPGTMYGRAGEGFLRINIACPFTQLKEGLMRIASVIGIETS